MPVHLGRDHIALGRRRRDLPTRDPAEQGHDQHADRAPAARNQAADDRSQQDGAVGAGLDQAGPREDFVAVQMLRKNRIFDRAEEGRMNPHGEQSGEHYND